MDAETGLERAMKLLISDLDGTLYPRKESLMLCDNGTKSERP